MPFISEVLRHNISDNILDAFHSLVRQPANQEEISKDYIGKPNRYNYPFSVSYYGAYPLMSQVEILEMKMEKANDVENFKSYQRDKVFEALKNYARGFQHGFDKFLEERITSPTSLSDANDFRFQKIIDYINQPFKQIGFTESYGKGRDIFEGWYRDGIESGYFYKAWYLILDNHQLFEPYFNKVKQTKDQNISSSEIKVIDNEYDEQITNTDKKNCFMPKYKNPRLFIGSSTEGLKIVNAIVRNLEHDLECNTWPHAFPLAHNTIDSLLSELAKNDFAAFVLSAEDAVKMRGEEFTVARDNVTFEAGLAIGKYGKLRCFLIVPRDVENFHAPTDLLGFTTASYVSERASDNPNNALISASDQIREAIKLNIWSALKLDIDSRVDSYDQSKLRFKNKIFLRFLNRENYSLRIELGEVRLRTYTVDPVDTIYGNKNYYSPKFITDLGGGKEHLYLEHTLKPGEQKDVWIPIDPSVNRDDLRQIIEKNSLGMLQFEVELLNGSDQKIIKNIIF